MINDYSILQQSVQSHALSLVSQWLPGGKICGREYQAINPRRHDRCIGSFSVNLTTGKWADFATGNSGGDLISLHAYLYGLRQSESARELCKLLGLEWGYRRSTTRDLPVPSTVTLQHRTNSEYARTLWKQSQPAQDTMVATYLKTRSIDVVPPSLRYLPAALHRPSGQRLPCMLAAITLWPDKQIVAVHRTFLKPDGSSKADVKQAKMMLGSISGGAVRLSPLGTTLVLAEGIETALSILASGDNSIGVWAVLSASNFRSLALPPASDLQNITIAADGDAAGIASANSAAELWNSQGYKVKIAVPPAGSDFNDLLVG